MAGQLLQVATETVTTNTNRLNLTGIDSDDVYLATYHNVQGSIDNTNFLIRLANSGTADISANYDYASKKLFVNTTFGTQSGTNNTSAPLGINLGNATNETAQGLIYIYNIYNASEYTFGTQEGSYQQYNGNNNHGWQGGWVHTVASSYNEFQFLFSSGDITSGTFTLYKVV